MTSFEAGGSQGQILLTRQGNAVVSIQPVERDIPFLVQGGWVVGIAPDSDPIPAGVDGYKVLQCTWNSYLPIPSLIGRV
jgi:hypothetical protein